MHNEMTFSTSC